MICTFYAHEPDFMSIRQKIQATFPKAKMVTEDQNEFKILNISIKGGLFKSDKKLRVAYRQRIEPSFKINNTQDPLEKNLAGMLGFVQSLPSSKPSVQQQLLQKIQSFNCEFSLFAEPANDSKVLELASEIAKSFDAVLFTPPNSPISKAAGQHFLDKDLNLILDNQGNCAIDTLEVKINSAYYDVPQETMSQDQIDRKAKNESFLTDRGIKVNKNLPYIESESTINLRTPQEVATRVVVLAVTNLVAFNNITGEEAIGFLKKFNLWEEATPKEQSFLENPTDDRKNHETWKCEGIWVLLWALNIVDDLKFPDHLCNLGEVPQEKYPINPGTDPNDFIAKHTSLRSKAEVLDANDLYYRFNWACVDARIHQQPMEKLHPGVVYERQYALNWLVHYMGQDWDDVTCDT